MTTSHAQSPFPLDISNSWAKALQSVLNPPSVARTKGLSCNWREWELGCIAAKDLKLGGWLRTMCFPSEAVTSAICHVAHGSWACCLSNDAFCISFYTIAGAAKSTKCIKAIQNVEYLSSLSPSLSVSISGWFIGLVSAKSASQANETVAHPSINI